MVHIDQIKIGLGRFMETEIVSKIPGWKRWVFGTGAAIILERLGEMLDQYKAHPVISALGIVDGDMVDLGTVYKHLRTQAAGGSAQIDIPMIGTMTISAADIEKLYKMILEVEKQ